MIIFILLVVAFSVLITLLVLDLKELYDMRKRRKEFEKIMNGLMDHIESCNCDECEDKETCPVRKV